MTKPMTPQQQLEQQEIARKYSDLKGMRERLISQKMIEVEAEMAQARAEFGEFLQHIYERENAPYRWTISGLATAMGTPSGRQTVKKYLGEATERRKNRFLDTFETMYSGLSIFAKKTWIGPFESHYYVVAVANEEANTLHIAVLSGNLGRYRTWRIDENTDIENVFSEDIPMFDKVEYKRDGNYAGADWLTWLDNEPEWLAFLGEAG